MRSPLPTIVCLLATAALAWRQPGDSRPNVVVFLPDTIRAESLGVYGHPLTRTPAAQRLAASGTTFLQAHVQHTQCAPSRCALLTGRYMHTLVVAQYQQMDRVNGLYARLVQCDRVYGTFRPTLSSYSHSLSLWHGSHTRRTGHRTQTHLVQSWENNLFAHLKNANYTTLMLGKNDMFAVDSFNKSLHFWESDTGVSEGKNPYAYGTPGYFSFLGSAGAALGNNSASNGDLHAVELASRWFKSNPPEPFMLFFSGNGAHPPYSAPRDYQTMYSAAEVEAAAPIRRVLDGANKPAFLDPRIGIPAFRNLTTLNDSFFYE